MGQGGLFSKSTFQLFLIEGSDIYLLLLIPWKNINLSRSYCWSKVSAVVKNELENLSSPTFFDQSS